MTKKTKGYREILKQIANRDKNYSVQYYVRNARKFSKRNDIRPSDIRSAFRRINKQFGYDVQEVNGVLVNLCYKPMLIAV